MTPDLHPAVEGFPPPAEKPLRLTVTGRGESELRRGEPWLMAERVREVGRPGAPGDLAVVYDRKRAFLAVGLYDPGAPGRLCVLRARSPGPVDAGLFGERLGDALARRVPLLAPAEPDATGGPIGDAAGGGRTDAFRWVMGESDGLPGLVVDRYADTVVVKAYSRAWLPWLGALLPEVLCERPAPAPPPPGRVVLRLSRQVAADPAALHGLHDGAWLCGSPGDGPPPDTRVRFRERGLLFEADPVAGQKTGWFLDQRDNRARVEALARGRRVLDVFCAGGGFTLAAARGGARSVLSVDQSAPALEAVRRHLALNTDVSAVADLAARDAHDARRGDAFEVLAALEAEGRRFDLVILDPPAFAHNKAQVPGALAAYARMTRLGLALLEPGGAIVLASCSQPVSADDFRATVTAAAAEAGRPLQGVSETGHALDHPTDWPGNRYLKALFATA